MSDPFIGEIQIFAFNFAPARWAFCAGQILPIQQNTALFSLLGTNYGGNGQNTFGLPNLQGQTVCATGQGPGLSQRDLGETFGSETVTLTSNQMPMHLHSANVYGQRDTTKRHSSPLAQDALLVPATITPFTTTNTVGGSFVPAMIGPATGGNQPHPNQQPYLTLNFCIALAGNFPPRP
ncbi:phage tail protein [Dyella sp. 20L07]|uniref:phage tail protein n=1 Tax=Dyella sp. 20L07 TaxID=3384240 RepID=UPI003D28188A